MKKLILSALVFMPMLASAQLSNVESLMRSIGRLVDIALPIVVGIALLGFFWGLAKFIFAAGDEGKRDEGKKVMIWGIVGLFVMVSVWGLVRFIGSALQIQEGANTPNIPSVPLR
jgi:hypothetical protein